MSIVPRLAACLATVVTVATAAPVSALAHDPHASAGRDPLRQPFSTDSIWNTPIGSHAVYRDTILRAEDSVTLDANHLLRPQRDGVFDTYRLRSPDGPAYPGDGDGVTYGGRCTGTGDYGPILFPRGTVIGDATLSPVYSTPNNATAIVYPDGRTIAQLQPAARCAPGADPHGYRATEEDLYGAGTYGGHFGSGLSSVGGQIAKGELTGHRPIMHALQLEVWGRKYLAYEAGSPTPGFHWPADRQDGYAKDPAYGYCTLDPCRSNPDPGLKMGALLAIPPTVTADSLGITNPAARRVFQALRDFGGYIVDDTGWTTNQIGIDAEAVTDVDQADPTWAGDVKTLWNSLRLVDNNGPRAVGGGGVPRVRPAPPLTRPPAPEPIALPRTGWRATAFANAGTAGRAIDGSARTGWHSDLPQENGQWFQVDLGRRRTFNRLTFDCEAFPFDFVQDYDVYVSDDWTTWTKVTHGSGGRSTTITFPWQTARYLQITSTGGGIDPAHQRWSIDDLRLWVNPAVHFGTTAGPAAGAS